MAHTTITHRTGTSSTYCNILTFPRRRVRQPVCEVHAHGAQPHGTMLRALRPAWPFPATHRCSGAMTQHQLHSTALLPAPPRRFQVPRTLQLAATAAACHGTAPTPSRRSQHLPATAQPHAPPSHALHRIRTPAHHHRAHFVSLSIFGNHRTAAPATITLPRPQSPCAPRPPWPPPAPGTP